uniref:Uncharacterized protein n=1 Tax=Timema shepardi TaxID=629360 RepID=A0A7R9FV73_TIMSH|nr:unnamed protein product [Timema shepardi]
MEVECKTTQYTQPGFELRSLSSEVKSNKRVTPYTTRPPKQLANALVVLSSTAEDGEIEVRISESRTTCHRQDRASPDKKTKDGRAQHNGNFLPPLLKATLHLDSSDQPFHQLTQHNNTNLEQTVVCHYCYSSPVASLVLTDSSQLTSGSQHLATLTADFWQSTFSYSSPMASLVLTDSSQQTSGSQHLGNDGTNWIGLCAEPKVLSAGLWNRGAILARIWIGRLMQTAVVNLNTPISVAMWSNVLLSCQTKLPKIRRDPGRGFGFLKHPVFVEAALDGHHLDTDLIMASPKPQFAVELTWETDKQSLKRLRTSCVPLKIECHTMLNPRQRDRVGYVLLNLRSAQIQSEHHNYKPPCPIDVTPAVMNSPRDMNPRMTSKLHTEEGIIQIGPEDMGSDIFLLTILVGVASNLQLLLPDQLDGRLEDSEFHFRYNILGYTIHTKPFSLTPGSNVVVPANEKIVVRIRSSLEMLKEYFTELSELKFHLMLEEEEIGYTGMSLKMLVPTDDLTMFCSHYAVNNSITQENLCFITGSKERTVPISSEGQRPSINIALKFKIVRGKDLITQKPMFTLESGTGRNNINHTVQHAQNNPQVNSYTQAMGERIPSQKIVTHPKNGPQSVRQGIYSASASHFDQNQQQSSSTRQARKPTTPPRLVSQMKISLFVGGRFHHPKAETISTAYPEIVVQEIGRVVPLQDFACKLSFISPPEQISRLLQASPPRVSVCGRMGGGQTLLLASASLDTTPLLVSDKKECHYTTPLLDVSSGERFGDLFVTLLLEDINEQQKMNKHPLRSNISEKDLGPAILDDKIASKIVEELEDWKDKQQELFKAQLQRKEEEHLTVLMEEWRKKRNEIESRMNRDAELCHQLVENLNKATEDLRVKMAKNDERELELRHTRDEMEIKFTRKLQDLKDASRRMEDDIKHKEVKADLEVRLSALQQENKLLQETLKLQEQELDKMRKSSLTKDQTASLLQELRAVEEKLEAAVKSKSFFKEQWARAVREIHRIKSEKQHAIQIHIRDSKEQLKNLGLVKLLGDGQTELREDQSLLQELRQEISRAQEDNDKPPPPPDSASSQRTRHSGGDTNQQIYVSPRVAANGSSYMLAQEMAGANEETERNIQALIEERDTLLRTGSYSIEENVISSTAEDSPSPLAIFCIFICASSQRVDSQAVGSVNSTKNGLNLLLISSRGDSVVTKETLELGQLFKDINIDSLDSLSIQLEASTTVNIRQDNGECLVITSTSDNVIPGDNTQVTQCFQLGDLHWFGGPERATQYWPWEKQNFSDYSYVTKQDANQGIADPYWFNSNGVYFLVNEDVPLFIDQNNLEENSLCFIAKNKDPYPEDATTLKLSYKLCKLSNAREAHEHAIENYLGKPSGVIDERMIRHPVWSTWARYKTNVNEQTVLTFADEILQHGFNNSQLEIDDNWETCYGSFESDTSKFPNMKNLTDALKERGFRVTLWIHPFINVDCELIHSLATENDYLVKNTNGSTLNNWWDGVGGAVDFSKTEAVDWWVERLRNVSKENGIDSFKFDAGETSWLPQLPVLNVSEGMNPIGHTSKYVRAVSQFGPFVEVRSAQRTQDLPVFVRMLDKDSRWGFNNGLRTLVTTLLQMNTVGYTFVLPDMIGGNAYGSDLATKELFIRWLQANTFMPALQFSIVPWDYDNERGHELYVSEYLLGESILVAPVMEEGATSRDIYLPGGTWRDELHPDQNPIQGRTWLRDFPAALDELPYFTKIG